MIKPPNFDPAKKYPVYQFLYGGPHAPQVRNRWGGGHASMLFHQLLAQQGVIVWVCDNRTASGKGAVSRLAGRTRISARASCATSRTRIAWLKPQPYVDGSRDRSSAAGATAGSWSRTR